VNEPSCLVVDTSSWIALRELPKPDRKAALAHFTELMTSQRLCFPADVARELGEQEGSEVHEWAKQHKRAAARGINTWERLPGVLARVPLIVDPSKAGGEEADPHLLAIALHLVEAGSQPLVVTEERSDWVNDRKRLTRMSLASACGVLKL
jgi:hypothetical protein